MYRSSWRASKLEKTLATLEAKAAALKDELIEQEKLMTGALFETDDAELNQHVVSLVQFPLLVLMSLVCPSKCVVLWRSAHRQ